MLGCVVLTQRCLPAANSLLGFLAWPGTGLILAFSLWMDAFAAANGKGASLREPPVIEILKIGAVFARLRRLRPIYIGG